MSNLMKAEWFRLRHSGNLIKWLVFICLCTVFLQFTGSNGFEISAKVYFSHASLVMGISVILTAAFITSTFDSRLVHYEIMKGTPPLKMIFSKILMALFIVTGLYFIPSVLLVGIADSDNITLPMMILLFVCMAKLITAAVCTCIFFKSEAGAMIFIFLYFFESMPLVILENFTDINASFLASLLTSTQLVMIGNQNVLDLDEMSLPLDSSFMELKIILSFLLLTAFMLFIAYKSLKEKWEMSIVLQQ